jgi:hypothetical protein
MRETLALDNKTRQRVTRNTTKDSNTTTPSAIESA